MSEERQPASPPLSFSNLEPGRKGEILDAAADVFTESGYKGGSMRAIASRVGVSEPAIYRHFPSKEALFLSLMRLAAGRLRAEAFALIDSVEAPTLGDQLVAAFRDRRQAMRFYAPIFKTMLTSVAFDPAFLAEWRAVIVEPIRERLTEKAAELDAKFGLADADESRAARVRALMALFVGYFVTSFVLVDESDEAIAEAALRVMGWPAGS
jgi:AcrR family transcriptional regulator